MRKSYVIRIMSWILTGMLLCGCAGKEEEGRGKENISGQEESQDGTDEMETSQGGTDDRGTPQEGTAEKEGAEGAAGNGTPQETEAAEKASFEGQDMEGNIVSSDIFSNSRLTMINVWATYCNPCLREMPELAQLPSEYASEDFQLIGIISDVQEGADQSAMETAEQLIEQTGADYPHLLLNESIYYGMLTDVMAVPTTFFVDSEGNILDTVVGAMDKSAWKEKIDGLLEELED